jgi:hypothetical protein
MIEKPENIDALMDLPTFALSMEGGGQCNLVKRARSTSAQSEGRLP